jgi:hypothetical protein
LTLAAATFAAVTSAAPALADILLKKDVTSADAASLWSTVTSIQQ